LDLRKIHQLTDEIEAVIRKILPGADVTVHPEPAEDPQIASGVNLPDDLSTGGPIDDPTIIEGPNP